MAYNFLPCDRNQSYLLPPSLADWLPEGHLAWFVLDAVEQIDLWPFYERYRTDGVGNSAFNPSLMVSLLLYAYCTGERSSRRIERFCQKIQECQPGLFQIRSSPDRHRNTCHVQ